MLLRNIIELVIMLVVAAAGLGVFMFVRRRASDYESGLVVRSKKEIKGRIDG